MKLAVIILLVIISGISNQVLFAQRSNVWCFGDSAGINFNSSTPIPITSSVSSRGSCASISDANGNLLFYSFTRAGIVDNSGLVFNSQHQLMQNGDSILGQGWYYEMTTIPDPADDSTFYLFSIGVTASSLPGLYYSKISFASNPLGEIISKNIQLLNIRMVDCLFAVKHGNGRDWWVIVKPSPQGSIGNNNKWYKYLISPLGISNANVQFLGSINSSGFVRAAFDTVLNKVAIVTGASLVELYDFDRCNGLLSNSITIEPPQQAQPFPYYWTSEFSPSGQYLYVGGYIANDSSYLWQYDTWSANIAASKTLIWHSNYPVSYVIGQLKRAPDGKIYLSNGWVDTTGNYQFPYLSNQYYPENMNLSVINSPDLPGTACDFQPYSFYLGGKRTYWGLPNNPDYELGPLIGSGCDTLSSLPPTASGLPLAKLNATWSPNWQKAFINATNLKGHKWRLEVFDLFGNIIYRDNGSLTPPYFSRGIELPGLASGMYVVRFQTERELLTGKFVVEW